VSPSGDTFAVKTSDALIRVFDFSTGKLRRTYDESPAAYTSVAALDLAELGKRLATEKELAADPLVPSCCNLAFDESGNFLLFASLVGIKVVNVKTNAVVRVIGAAEAGERFTAIVSSLLLICLHSY
jgi:peptidylprolyl isomerase domain and WD repeat-containing protein 1